jgi:hypothetical protein
VRLSSARGSYIDIPLRMKGDICFCYNKLNDRVTSLQIPVGGVGTRNSELGT